MDFPSNTNKGKETPKSKPEKNVERVVTSTVVKRQKPFGRRLREVFLGGELKSATRYIAAEVLLPALRNMIVDATSKGVERMIYGDSTPRRGSNRDNRARMQYNNPVNRGYPRANLPDQPPRANPRRQDVSDMVLVSREEADLVVERMNDIIDMYEVASVADLYNLVGLPTTYVDNQWGWSNLNYVNVRQVRDGYLIDLPHAEPI